MPQRTLPDFTAGTSVTAALMNRNPRGWSWWSWQTQSVVAPAGGSVNYLAAEVALQANRFYKIDVQCGPMALLGNDAAGMEVRLWVNGQIRLTQRHHFPANSAGKYANGPSLKWPWATSSAITLPIVVQIQMLGAVSGTMDFGGSLYVEDLGPSS